MKPLGLILALVALFPVISAQGPQPLARDCKDVPELNRCIAAFVKSKVNTTVGRGECWDLAAEALNKYGATWDNNYNFGKVLRCGKDCIFPGDIIQFEGVQVVYTRGNVTYRETMTLHTAVICEVHTDGSFVLAEQNTSDGGRRVRFSPFNPSNVRSGKFTIYRPTNL
jgi:hypothetical protein